ncbi:MAG: MmcQ/YjbR family DNA-binding protein [Anaerolineae bacterium]|nr:MmcQ/YjbR family DNA-binding protein [Anaerolineae bacterium]
MDEAAGANDVFEVVRQIARQLPGIEEGTSYGTPALRARGKFLARLHDNREALVLKVGDMEQTFLIETEPAYFYITDHYRGTPYVLVRLSVIDPTILHDLIVQAWRGIASKQDIATYEARRKA